MFYGLKSIMWDLIIIMTSFLSVYLCVNSSHESYRNEFCNFDIYTSVYFSFTTELATESY